MFSKLSFFLTQIFFKTHGFFFKLRFFFPIRLFFENQVFDCLEQYACHISADHDCWLKENEQNGVDDQNGFYLFYASCPIG